MKRIFSAILTVLMVIMMLSTVTFAASFTKTSGPAVFIVDDNYYNIIWTTTNYTKALAYVEYTYNGVTKRVYDEDNGVIRTDDFIHAVTVPIKELDAAGKYSITAVPVTSRSVNSLTLGSALTTSNIAFRGYNPSKKDIVIYTASDAHMTSDAMVQRAYDSISKLKLRADPDLLALSGDMTNTMNYLTDISSRIVALASKVTGGNIPTMYLRGNHETHGVFAGNLPSYFKSDDGHSYSTWSYGPLSCIRLEYGEDKPDSYPTFNGLADFNDFYIEQLEWLEGLGGYGDENTEYRIAFGHGGDIKNHYGYDLLQTLNAYGTDLLVCGHSHILEMSYPANFEGTGDPDLKQQGGWLPGGFDAYWTYGFPIFRDGSENTDHVELFNTSMVTLSDGKISVYGIEETSDGVYADRIDCSFDAGKNPVIPNFVPATLTDYRMEHPANSTADTYVPDGSTKVLSDTSASFGFTSKPTVFDTGDTYTVVWSTTAGKMASGEVFVDCGGKLLRFTDNNSGSLRIHNNGYSMQTDEKNIHAVDIPKKYLENNKYKVISRHIVNADYLSMDKGSTAETPYIQFTGYTGQDEINMLVCSDLAKMGSAYDTVSGLSADCDLLALCGNTMSTVEKSANVTAQLLSITGKLTSGKKPVVFVRGENETLGEFAPYLGDILKTSTGEFYGKWSYGPITAVTLDSSETHRDNMNSLLPTAFEKVRSKQKAWLGKTTLGDAAYKLAFSNVDGVYDIAGYNYTRELNTLGVDMLVTGDGQSSYFTGKGYRSQNYAVVNNGQDDGTVATLLTFANGSITAKPLNKTGTALAQNTVDTSANDLVTFNDVSKGAWFEDAVLYSAGQLVMLGTSADTFAPESKLTRGMAVTALARMSNVDLDAYSQDTVFTDVDADSYYAKAVAWAYASGIALGTSKDTFAPEEFVTREQICTMFYRMFKDKLTDTTPAPFDDYDEISEYAKTAVSALYNAKIINGVGKNKFAPKHTVTRAQLAQIIYKSEF